MGKRTEKALEIGSSLNFIFAYDSAVNWGTDKIAREFYLKQHETAKELSKKYFVPLDRVCAAMAVLSPGIPWSQLLESIERLVSGKVFGLQGYGQNIVKAHKLILGEPVEEILKGPKVTNFYHNILEPFNDNYITIDAHMYSCWIGKRVTIKHCPEIKDIYDFILKDLRIAADVRLEKPTVFQAIVWMEHRRKYLWPQAHLFTTEETVTNKIWM